MIKSLKSRSAFYRVIIKITIWCVLIVFGAYFYANSVMFPAPESRYNTDLEGLFFLDTPDGEKIAGRSWRSPGADILVIYFHGNGEDIGTIEPVAQAISNLGYDVLAFDYRGYGLSSGSPSEASIYRDSKLMLDHAKSMGYSENRIVLWGQSLGTGAAVDLATQGQFKGLVLISPFKSIYTIVTRYPVIPFDRFTNFKKLQTLNVPLYLMHGAQDSLIPVTHARQINEQYSGKKCLTVLDQAGHNDVWLYGGAGLIQQMMTFVVNDDATCLSDK